MKFVRGEREFYPYHYGVGFCGRETGKQAIDEIMKTLLLNYSKICSNDPSIKLMLIEGKIFFFSMKQTSTLCLRHKVMRMKF